MTENLEITGERLVEHHYIESLGGYVIYMMHVASYRFAERYCSGARVLDLGCGSGYGAGAIAEYANEVHAVDISAESIAFARSQYGQPNLHFNVIHSGERLPFPDRSFDVVLSFQVIEHVERDSDYLIEAARVLKDGGTFIMITPNRQHRLLPGQCPWNRWHLREYDMRRLSRLVSEHFNLKELLHMGARSDVAAIEIRRYRLLKWITLPFTFPGAPQIWRRMGLNLIHRLKPQKPRTRTTFKPSFGLEVIMIGTEVEQSLNLIVIATPKRKQSDLGERT